MPVNNILQHKPTFDTADYPSKISSLVDSLQIAAENPSFPCAYNPTTTSGLVFGWYAGEMLVDGVQTTVAAGTVSLTASSTNYVEMTRAGVVSVNATGFTAGRIPLYTVVTGLTSINTVTDHRMFNQPTSARHAISTTGGTITLTAVQARCDIIDVSGALTQNLIVELPAVPWSGFVRNATSGNYTLTVKVTGQAGVVVPQGYSRPTFCDGTDVRDASGFLPLSGGNMTGVFNDNAISMSAASVTDIATATGNFIAVSGNTTITDFGSSTQTGALRSLRFSGSPLITHNASKIVLPQGEDYQVSAGDVLTFRCVSFGVWALESANLADGSYIGNRIGDSIAASSTINLAAATGETVNITGTATVTSLGTNVKAGLFRRMVFAVDGTILTHNATSLILPGSSNITCSAGDVAEFISLGSNNWRCTSYQRFGNVAFWSWSISGKTADFTVTSADHTKLFYVTGSAAKVNATLPNPGSVPAGFMIAFRNDKSSGMLTLLGGGFTIEGASTLDLGIGSGRVLYNTGTKWLFIENGITSVSSGTTYTQAVVYNYSTGPVPTFTPTVVPYKVSLWGAGASGGLGSSPGGSISGYASRGGKGGGGGGFASGEFSSAIGTPLSVIVGKGGDAVTTWSNGNNGGTSSISAIGISATGGVGGARGDVQFPGSPTTLTGGEGGTGTGGTVNLTGSPGATSGAGSATNSSSGGGGGGAAAGISGVTYSAQTSPAPNSTASFIGGDGAPSSNGVAGGVAAASAAGGDAPAVTTSAASKVGGGGGAGGASSGSSSNAYAGGAGAIPGGGGGGGGGVAYSNNAGFACPSSGPGAHGRVLIEFNI